MIIKGLVDVDFINYKQPSMIVLFPKCNFKCGGDLCQNNKLIKEPDIEINPDDIALRYSKNEISEAIVMSGMDPMDSWEDLWTLIDRLRYFTEDTIVIYTGYTEDELQDKIKILKNYKRIIIKFGRYIPNQAPHFDEVLGVNLASDNQYAKRIN